MDNKPYTDKEKKETETDYQKLVKAFGGRAQKAENKKSDVPDPANQAKPDANTPKKKIQKIMGKSPHLSPFPIEK